MSRPVSDYLVINHQEMATFISDAVYHHSAGRPALCQCRFCVHGRRLLRSFEYLRDSTSFITSGVSK